MSTIFDTEEHLESHHDADTEFTLSTASLLGIFFALALVCGVFFGLGYWMGHRSTDLKAENGTATSNATRTVTNTDSTALRPKPAASQNLPSQNLPSTAPEPPAAATRSAEPPPRTTPPATSLAAVEPPAQRPPVKTAAVAPPPQVDSAYKTPSPKTSPAKRPAFDQSAPVAAPASHPPASYPASQPAPTANVSPIVVQIAAVSHQEDAEVLIAALKKRGYNVGIRREPQDQLMHVQVGPFNTRADATAMRQRLLADGYNAIVKP